MICGLYQSPLSGPQCLMYDAPMDLELRDKTAIVTGASKGIGRAIAMRLAQEGMDLAIVARSAALLQSLAGEIQTAGRSVAVFAMDLRDAAIPGRIVEQVMARMGRIDLLVNNAGATRRGDFLALSEDDWSDGFALKFFAAVRLSRAAWPHLAKAQGSIINIAGVGGRTGSAEFTIGGSVNAAMLNLTKSLADCGVHDHVRVNAINPGSIQTDRLTTRLQRFAQERRISIEAAATQMAADMGLARFGAVEEIADAVAFLASPRASYIQGAILDIDGGLTRTL